MRKFKDTIWAVYRRITVYHQKTGRPIRKEWDLDEIFPTKKEAEHYKQSVGPFEPPEDYHVELYVRRHNRP